jgi:formate-nitrite transporter family protein
MPRTRFSAEEIHDNIETSAREELERPPSALFWSGLAAGVSITASFLLSAYVTTLVEPRFQRAAAALAYPIGFAFVVIGRQQLFTENTLEPIIPLLSQVTRERLRQVATLYAMVLAGNLVGGLVMALLLAYTPVTEPSLLPALDTTARHAFEGGAWTVLYKGIYAGWLVAMMAWLIGATRNATAQLVLIWLATAPISALGFRHSIAGAVEAWYAAARTLVPWSAALGEFILPAVVGNVIGGVVFVALLNHRQVNAEA